MDDMLHGITEKGQRSTAPETKKTKNTCQYPGGCTRIGFRLRYHLTGAVRTPGLHRHISINDRMHDVYNICCFSSCLGLMRKRFRVRRWWAAPTHGRASVRPDLSRNITNMSWFTRLVGLSFLVHVCFQQLLLDHFIDRFTKFSTWKYLKFPK